MINCVDFNDKINSSTKKTIKLIAFTKTLLLIVVSEIVK